MEAKFMTPGSDLGWNPWVKPGSYAERWDLVVEFNVGPKGETPGWDLRVGSRGDPGMRPEGGTQCGTQG